jgi:signal transduction histidine kinase
VRQVVRQHGGTVTAEPAPGGGTLMRVRLPGAETVVPESAPPREAGVKALSSL